MSCHNRGHQELNRNPGQSAIIFFIKSSWLKLNVVIKFLINVKYQKKMKFDKNTLIYLSPGFLQICLMKFFINRKLIAKTKNKHQCFNYFKSLKKKF